MSRTFDPSGTAPSTGACTQSEQPCLRVIRQEISSLATILAAAPRSADRQLATECLALLRKLDAATEYDLLSLGAYDHCRDYSNWARNYFGVVLPCPPYPLALSFGWEDEWGKKFLTLLMPLIVAFEQSLIREIASNHVSGAVAEFGVFEGYMLNNLIEECEKIGYQPNIYGFDSFQGLSEPSETDDYPAWKAGQYAADYDSVCRALQLEKRPQVKLIKGFFAESLKRPEAQAIDAIAYARIDCDIYPPTVDCLDFIGPRLSNGAILVFDDWVFDIHKGETKAFYEWLPKVPHLKFEFIAFLTSRLYLRAKHVALGGGSGA